MWPTEPLTLDDRIAIIVEFAGLDPEQIARFRRGLDLTGHVIVHENDVAPEAQNQPSGGDDRG